MRKFALLLTIISMISCGKKTNSNAVDSDSIAEVIDSAVSFHEEYIPSTDTKETGITLDFSSYHLYTCEEDKYDANGYQPVSAKVTIDEASNAASLKLYDSGEHKWYPFDFRIDEKLHLQEGVITYKVYNNANQVGYIYISTNRPDGLFVDINNFTFDGNPIGCWMQESGSSGSQYRESVTTQASPNAYSSTSNTYSSSPNAYSSQDTSTEDNDFHNWKEDEISAFYVEIEDCESDEKAEYISNKYYLGEYIQEGYRYFARTTVKNGTYEAEVGEKVSNKLFKIKGTDIFMLFRWLPDASKWDEGVLDVWNNKGSFYKKPD